jgi:PKD repeat protein
MVQPSQPQRTLPTAPPSRAAPRGDIAATPAGRTALGGDRGRSGTGRIAAAALGIALLAPALALPAAAVEAPAAMRFGMDINSIQPQTDAGIKPDYGLFWVGVWNLKSGWGSPDNQMDKARAAGVTPVIQFYYWGDDISQSCITNGCWSSLHNSWKDQANWSKLAQQLVDHLHARMQGKPAVIVLETEFNKGGVNTWEPLDAMLEEKARFFKEKYPASTVVLGFGNWGRDKWGTFDRAAAASDMTGVQAMRGSTRNSLTSYYGLVDGTLDGAKALKQTFGKPVFVSDVALSSYPEPEYLGHQANMTKALFDRMPELKAAGIQALVYRTFKDNPNMDLANYYGQAERHWGMAWAGNLTWKPSMTAWVDGIKAERANPAWPTGQAPPPPPPPAAAVGPDALARVEAEAFAVRTAGGPQSSGEASGGTFWNLWSNGHLEQGLAFAAPGAYEVRVRAKGSLAEGVGPRMEMSLGGQPIGRADPGLAWQDHAAWVHVQAAGEQALRLAFTNDVKVGSEDRNLLLDAVEVEWMGRLPEASSGNSTRAEAEAFTSLAQGSVVKDKAAAGGMAVRLTQNGSIATTLALQEGRHSVRAVARGEPQGGVWPSLELRLGGIALATRGVAFPGYKVFYAEGDARGTGAHEVALAFTNDVAPAGGEDLAMVVDRIAVENLGPLRNAAPRADFWATLGGLALRAESLSSDPDGDALTLRWDLGDGTHKEGAQVEHTYAAPGVYKVTLTAGDGRLTTSVTQEFEAVRPNRAPLPQFTWSADGLTVAVDSQGTRDPDGDALALAWHWGDGAVTEGGDVASHTYAANGTYVIKLVASDGALEARAHRELVVRAHDVPTPGKLVLDQGLQVNPQAPVEGERVAFAFVVRNAGGLPLALAKVGVVVAGREMAVGPIALDAGATYAFRAAAPLRAGSHEAVAFAHVEGAAGPETLAPGGAGTMNPVPVVVAAARAP